MFRAAKTVVTRVNRLCLQQQRWYSTHAPQTEKKITLLDIAKKHKQGTPLTMVTAYDYTSAYFVDKAAVDVILVGDSLGMVMLGRNSTTEVTMDEMLHHCKAVARGSKRAFVVGDMPFGSFEVSPNEAVHNAIRLVKEGSVAAVKLEGGKVRRNAVRAIVDAGIPVIGHIGLTPQTAGSFGGFKVQGKSAAAAASIFEDALALQEAGCSALVIEFVPELLGQAITKGINIPTFGIGAGRHTSGQVLVYHDMLGMYPDFTPKFCKQYANLAEEITKGISSFKEEVEGKQFPTLAHSFTMKSEEWDKAHEIILQTHSNKEGSDATILKALEHVKASMAQSAKEEREKATVEKATVEKASPVVQQASPSKESSSTPSSSPSVSSIPFPAPSPSPSPSRPITSYPTYIPTRKPPTWVTNIVTNFDVYYNSYFNNNEEDDRSNEEIEGERRTKKRAQKM